MTPRQISITPAKGWFPLILITILTLAIFIISIISLLSGWLTIFQNLFYFPIILACVYYLKRGFVFSVLLACSYFILIIIFSNDPVVLQGALVRLLIFILVAGVITYLSIIRIRAEDALKESEEFNRGLVENMPNLVMVYDHDRKIRYVNPTASTILGYSIDEMVGTDIITYVVPHQHAEIEAATQERFSSGRGGSLEVEIITKNGQHLTVISKGAPLHFRNQPAVLILLADISDRKRAEEALQESEIKFHTMADFTVDWEYWLAPDNNFVYISPSCDVITGYSQEEFTKDPTLLTKIVYMDDALLYSDHFTRIHRSVKEGNLDFRIMRKEGEIRWIAHSCKPVYDRDGTYLGRRASNRDITERKQVEEALHHANNKLNLLSSITRHDINNQLTVLQGYLTLIEQKQSDPVLNNYLQKAATAAERISSMIQFTKEYENIGVHAPIWQDCHTLLTTAAKQASLGHVELKNDLPSGTEVFADPLIVKVCYNLMDNAVRYGGKITTIRFSVENYNGDHVVVCEDNGVGVPTEEKEKIFIRGFGKNTGLGLFLSREILGISGITIRETGEPGKGARFEMMVPKGVWRIGKEP
jgi:PAS domain S-box-containing protein